tara:strand:- start:435 stop:608 length:174 start_codon:yes stop_codon:yes gene_type:complete
MVSVMIVHLLTLSWWKIYSAEFNAPGRDDISSKVYIDLITKSFYGFSNYFGAGIQGV